MHYRMLHQIRLWQQIHQKKIRLQQAIVDFEARDGVRHIH